MTILPGTGTADEPSFESPSGRGPRPNLTVIVAIGVVVALLAGGAWWLLRGSDSAKPTTPAAVVHHAAPPKGLPASGPVTPGQVRRLADVVFAALPGELPGYRSMGRVRVIHATGTKLGRAIARCAGTTLVPSTNGESKTYVQGTHFFSAEVVVDPSHAGAVRDLGMSSPRAVACAQKLSGSRGIPLDNGLTATDLTVHASAIKGLKGARMVTVTGVARGDGVDGTPVRLVSVMAVTGRLLVSVDGVGLGEAVPTSSDVALLRALLARAKTQL